MITVANRIYVAPEYQEEFEKRFQNRSRLVDGMPGFISNQVLRPVNDDDPYIVFTLWESRKDFESWVESAEFRKGHAQSGTLPNSRSPIDLDTSDLTTTIHGYANVTGSARTEYQLTPATNLIFSGQYFAQDQEGISENGPIAFDQLGDIENFSGSLGIAHESGGTTQGTPGTLLTGKLYAIRYDV